MFQAPRGPGSGSSVCPDSPMTSVSFSAFRTLAPHRAEETVMRHAPPGGGTDTKEALRMKVGPWRSEEHPGSHRTQLCAPTVWL